MATSEQVHAKSQAQSIPPEFAERMRQRRPGYDQVAELVQRYDANPIEARAKIDKEKLDLTWIRPLFQALGWEVWSGSGFDKQLSYDFELAYQNLRVPVEVRESGQSLDSYTLKGLGAWEILTNFELVLIWDLRDPSNPSVFLETGPRFYVADGSDEHDLLAAQIFYEKLVQPISEKTQAPASPQQSPPLKTISDVPDAPKFDAYLSFNSRDRQWVTKLKADLEKYGLSIWLDQDELRPGDDWAKKIELAVANSKTTIVVVSPASMQSNFVKRDIDQVMALLEQDQSIKIIPIILEYTDIPPELARFQWVDFRNTENDDEAYDQKVWELVEGITGQRPPEVLKLKETATQAASQRIEPSGIESGEALGMPSVTQHLSEQPPTNGQSILDAQANTRTVGLTEEVTALKIPASGFDSPVGSEEERSGESVWPESWLEILSYLSPLPDVPRNFSPGVRLVPQPTFPVTYEVYAPANGKVVFARLADAGWFGTIIIESTLPDQTRVFSRISQLTEITVNSDEQVYRGQLIGRIDLGQPDKYLLYEIARSDILLTEPFHWVVNNQQVINEHYFNPTEFTRANRPERYFGRYGDPDGPRQRFEEIMAGVSVGGGEAPARTITALVTGSAGQPLILLAGGTFPPGTEVIQPAPAHGSQRQDRIGIVEREVFNERSLGAVARLDCERSFSSLLPNRLPVTGVTAPILDMSVCKFGGGSGYSVSRIVRPDASVDFTDDYQRSIRLHEAFYVEGPGFSQPGDIGALVATVEVPHRAIGVIVGYSEEYAVCLPIQPILDQLQVELITQPVLYRRTQQATEQITAANDRAEGQDRLGFEEYARAFIRLIQDTTPPLTIGIYGAWGTGKSFLMNLIEEKLDALKSDILVVKIEAWDYNTSDKVWAGLIKQIFQAVEARLGWYAQIRLSLEPNLEREWRKLRSRLLPYTLIAIVIGLFMLAFIWSNRETLVNIFTGIAGLAALGILFDIGRQLYGIFNAPASERIVSLFATADYRREIDFMEHIRNDLQNLAQKLPEKMKIVVFIDDLDRCDPKKAVEVIEAIKLLLDFDRFIVFMAIDARIITQAVEEHYGKILVEAEITGYEYLDKIVQIPFSIPEPPPNELRQYLGSLVSMDSIPPLEPIAEVVEREQPPTFVAEPAPPDGSVTSPSPPVEAPLPAGRTEEEISPPPFGEEKVAEKQEAVSPETSTDVPVTPTHPPEPAEKIEERYQTDRVNFTRSEQNAFLAFHTYLDPNPRRLKRLVNIYRLVRTLIANRRQTVTEGNLSASAMTTLPENPHYILGWLILCEQWPYAAHIMLDLLDQNLKRTALDVKAQQELLVYPISQLYEVAQIRSP